MSLANSALISEIQRRVVDWERKNYVPYPWRVYRDPYKVLISEVLLKRTTRQAVAKEFPKFVARYPSIREIYEASVEELEEFFRHLGLYRQRARQLKELARVLVEKYEGRVPATWEDLISLPGLGVYTAGAVLSFGFSRKAPVADSNVVRLLSRLTGLKFRNPEDCLALMWVLVPEQDHEYFNYGMIDLGSSVCHYREPKCTNCPLSDLCVYNVSRADERAASSLRDSYAALYRSGREYLRQRKGEGGSG